MKIYSKLSNKIKNNKNKVRTALSIVLLALGLKYGNGNNKIPINWSSNGNQEAIKEQNFFKRDTLTKDTNDKLIKTGYGLLISKKNISQGSKSALEIRSGDLGKSGPGAQAKSDALKNGKAGKLSSTSSIISGAEALVP